MRRKDFVQRGVRCLLASLMALVLTMTPAVPALAEIDPSIADIVLHAQAGEFAVIRLAGADRYETMAKVVEQGYGSSDWAVVVSGDDYADALMAAGLAGSKHAPVVLTQKGALTEAATRQLRRMNANHVFIVGGTDAVSESVESDLEAMGITVYRVAGTNRYSTGVDAMNEIRKAGSKTDAVIIASGRDFADALSIGSWAHVSASPIVLTQDNGALPKATVDAIKADKGLHRVIIVGGYSAVSDDVLGQLGTGYEYTRLGGANRYETSAGIAEWTTTHGLSWGNVALVTGNHFADALSGAATMGDPPMGDYHGPILLVSNVNDPTVKLLQNHAAEVAICFVFGGTSSVSEALADPALYGRAPQQSAIQTVATTQTQFVPTTPTQVEAGAVAVVDTTTVSTVPVNYGSTGSSGTTSGGTTSGGTTSSGTSSSSSSGSTNTSNALAYYDPNDPSKNEIKNYIGDSVTKKFHSDGCWTLPWTNAVDLSDKSYNEIVEMGYTPCGNCHATRWK